MLITIVAALATIRILSMVSSRTLHKISHTVLSVGLSLAFDPYHFSLSGISSHFKPATGSAWIFRAIPSVPMFVLLRC